MSTSTQPNFASFEPARRMTATGIGFAGLSGAWWRPAVAPFPLPAQAAQDLAAISRALFALFDAVADCYGEDSAVTDLLEHKVPAGIPRWASAHPVLSLRPDFQLSPRPPAPPPPRAARPYSDLPPEPSDGGAPGERVGDRGASGERGEGGYQLIATELEMCPSAHGFAHAMQMAYGLEPDLARTFARFLAGRELWFVGSAQWSEFLIEQLAFCRALAEHGARGRVLYDLPLDVIAREFRAGRRWQPPMFGVRQKPASWDDDLLGRLGRAGLLEYAWTSAEWPAEAAPAALFRFGYFDCFAPERLAQFQRWEAQGALPLNPATFYLDSKAVLAAARLPQVLERVAARQAAGPAILARCLPETLLVQPAATARLLAEREQWVLKFAGFDHGQQAWGGRSLQIGAAHTPASWEAALRQYLALPFPVVAQRLTPSAVVDIPYLDDQGRPQTLPAGVTRLRSFFLRGQTPAGSHLTVSGGTMQVSEATEAVQAPVVFQT